MSESPDGDSTHTASGELASEQLSRPAQWLLLDGERWIVAVGLLFGLGVALAALLASGAGAVVNQNSLTRLFSALVGGNLTLITVVISINQLVLSREFGTPDELEARIQEVIEYRREVEAAAGAGVSPVTPETFLDYMAHQIHQEAVTLRETATETADEECRADVEEYTGMLVTQAERISDTLERRPSGAFHTLMTILDSDLTYDLYAAERLRSDHEESLSPTATTALEDLYDLIEYMGVARQYFKTLYMHRELAGLSRKILYTGVPAVGAAVCMVWVYGHPAGARLTSPLLELTAVAATLTAFIPLATLIAYVLRVTTIARRTASLMPFKISERSSL